jgi:hypothetical protein
VDLLDAVQARRAVTRRASRLTDSWSTASFCSATGATLRRPSRAARSSRPAFALAVAPSLPSTTAARGRASWASPGATSPTRSWVISAAVASTFVGMIAPRLSRAVTALNRWRRLRRIRGAR